MKVGDGGGDVSLVQHGGACERSRVPLGDDVTATSSGTSSMADG